MGEFVFTNLERASRFVACLDRGSSFEKSLLVNAAKDLLWLEVDCVAKVRLSVGLHRQLVEVLVLVHVGFAGEQEGLHFFSELWGRDIVMLEHISSSVVQAVANTLQLHPMTESELRADLLGLVPRSHVPVDSFRQHWCGVYHDRLVPVTLFDVFIALGSIERHIGRSQVLHLLRNVVVIFHDRFFRHLLKEISYSILVFYAQFVRILFLLPCFLRLDVGE